MLCCGCYAFFVPKPLKVTDFGFRDFLTTIFCIFKSPFVNILIIFATTYYLMKSILQDHFYYVYHEFLTCKYKNVCDSVIMIDLFEWSRMINVFSIFLKNNITPADVFCACCLLLLSAMRFFKSVFLLLLSAVAFKKQEKREGLLEVLAHKLQLVSNN